MLSRMRSSWVLLSVLGTGACGFHSHATAAGDDQAIDGGTGREIDAGPVDAPPCHTFSAQLDTCAITFGEGVTLSGTLTFDTANATLTDGTGQPVVVPHMTIATKGAMVEAIFAHDITLTAGTTLRAKGDKPFALIALDTITLADNAVIDVSAGGAGARTACTDGGQVAATAGENSGDGAGGGGGGGYGANGGDGGDGNSDHIGGRTSHGGAKGTKITAMPVGPLGGCPGGAGGRGDDNGGSGGNGGGALFLAAGNQISLGTTTAPAMLSAGGAGGSGGGGGGSDGDAGGGGGGSGGMLWLEASHLVGPLAIIAANGGGGGEGSGNGAAGNPGATGALSLARALGGAGNSPTGADGAAGGNATTTTGDKPASVLAGGGGGGGGSVGFISIVSANPGTFAIVSPTAVITAP